MSRPRRGRILRCMLPEIGPQSGVLLVLIGLVLVLCALAWRRWAVSGGANRSDAALASVFRIMVGVAGGIVLASVLLLMLVVALAR